MTKYEGRVYGEHAFNNNPDYTSPHACFDCRKSYKIAFRSTAPKCPHCGSELWEMGRSFKAPMRVDREQWLKVQSLREAGYYFAFTTDRHHPPYPERLRDLDRFMAENPCHAYRIRKFWPTWARNLAN